MNFIKRLTTISLAVCMLFASGGCGVVEKIKDDYEESTTEITEGEAPPRAEVSNSISLGMIDFDTFNPLLTQSQTVRESMQFVYEPLFDVDEKLQPVPVLAESYTVSPDGRTIDIIMRGGVTWHDGSMFTVADAAYTMKQIISGITPYTDCLANVADYMGYDDDRLRIVLRYAVPNFVTMLNFPIIKYQSDMTADPNYIPIGTGAYRYESQSGMGKVSFAAYDNYHGGRANIDRIYLYTIPDLAKYESMFEANEIDLLTDNTVDLSEYTPRGGYTNNDYVTNRMIYLGYNMQSPILGGVNTRRGLSKIIDKDTIVNSTIYSRGVAVDVPINPSSIYYYDTNTHFRREESVALSLLGDDGWGADASGEYVREVNGELQRLAFEIITDEAYSERVSVAQKIASEMNSIGIRAEAVPLPYEEYAARIESGAFDAVLGEINILPNGDLTQLVTSAGNILNYGSVTLDTLIGQMGMTQDEETLKTLFREYGDLLVEEMPFTALYFKKGNVLSGSKIKTEIFPSVSRSFRNVNTWSVIA